MGGFLGIGESDAEAALKYQREQNAKDIADAQSAEAKRLEDKKNAKGPKIAKIKLGKSDDLDEEASTVPKKDGRISQSRGLSTGSGKTGVQL